MWIARPETLGDVWITASLKGCEFYDKEHELVFQHLWADDSSLELDATTNGIRLGI
jgi:hypothetical protein